jgi:nucleotide-binding universal stress UspA family protein
MRRDVELIVMGSRRAGTTNRLLFGSVAERVLRGAPCPVLVVGPEAGKAG